VGKRGREEASVHVLKPRGVLHGRTGVGDVGGARGGSGDGSATWSGRGKPARGRGSGGRSSGGHVAQLRAARGQLGLGRTAGEGGGGRRREETKEAGLEEDDEDRSAISQNCRDSTVKSR
jgi:hypothetical protein